MTKKILGLDLGTNSIGWALIEQDFENKRGSILGLGTRIIPMSQEIIDTFGQGQSHSQTADRTKARSVRKLYQRDSLRRERLHRVLEILDFLPEHYKSQIDFTTHKGQFINYTEPKLPYSLNESGKYEFLFKNSFNEMLEEFKKSQPELLNSVNRKGEPARIPYDWTIYYLRKKALTQKISKEELAWIILNFNKKRGYYQLSEQDEEYTNDKIKEYVALKVKEVKDSGEKIKGTNNLLYDIFFENGWKYDKQTTKPSDWENKTKEFIVTTSKTKNGEIKRIYKAVNSEEDWIAIKKKTEQDIERSDKTVGTYIYDTLLANPTQKIRGKLVRTIERKFYKEELRMILDKQLKEHSEFSDQALYATCIQELYPHNENHRKGIENRNFRYLLMDDIIFYQRPLKSKTHLIGNCQLEYRIRKDNKERIPVKCIAKSNPFFQEFRLWQFLSNLKLYELEKEENGKTVFDVNVTSLYLSTEEKWIELFEWLNNKDTISQKQLLSFFKLKEEKYRWNYIEDKEYPCNETRAKFLIRLKKTDNKDFTLTSEITQHLWHILYSVTDPEQRKSAIEKFAKKHGLNQAFSDSFIKFPPYKRDYGSFSEKAIKKLLPLMRNGKYWNWNNINCETQKRIDKLITGEYDERIKSLVREKAISLSEKNHFKALPLWLASYVVYDKHAEASDTKKWETSAEIAYFLKHEFKQHSLRNPIVEQVLTETLRVVGDIWDEFGNGEKNFFDEIHIELGREMKNDKRTRERITSQVKENENTNLRIKALLNELKESGTDIRPHSPSQQEILKIYEEGVYLSESRKDQLDEIEKIRKNNSPSKMEIQRYRLWLEQGYISPYTGKAIGLTELFSHKYQIEHIFPQSRYFNDSLSNKVICEAEINQLKDNRTAYEFIKEFGGNIVSLGEGLTAKIHTLSDYENHVKTYFSKSKIKRENLLSVDIPESFINRQMNDSRYISKIVKNLLSKIVRDEDEKEVISKYIIPVSGMITSQMKNDWGLNDVWNDIIAPRFERMNALTRSQDFGAINPNTNKFLPNVPPSLSKGFSKKRIDHRHHALDALIIACITREHVNYITSINTERKNYSLVNKLRYIEEIEKVIKKSDGTQVLEKRKVAKDFYKPWQTFTQDVRQKLETTIVSFKQNTRVINKAKNKYQKFIEDENGKLTKKLVPQIKGENWAIRKPLHKDTIYGKVFLKRNGKIIEATAGRVELSEKFTRKHLESITDTGIQKIFENHIKNYLDDKGKEQFDLAFNPEGVDKLNENIIILNNGVFHQPIRKVRIYEEGNRFAVGQNGNKKDKYVEAAKGTNLFFAVYIGKNKKEELVRQYSTIPLNEVIESLKQGGKPAPDKYYDKDKNEYSILFTLSPNDLVYVPTVEEKQNSLKIDFTNLTKEQLNRIYRFTDSSDTTANFIPFNVSNLLFNIPKKEQEKRGINFHIQNEFGLGSPQSKNQKSIDDIMIKECCIKLKVDRLGNISKA
jgi:CRISPR-associated endonuclease Csn1